MGLLYDIFMHLDTLSWFLAYGGEKREIWANIFFFWLTI